MGCIRGVNWVQLIVGFLKPRTKIILPLKANGNINKHDQIVSGNPIPIRRLLKGFERLIYVMCHIHTNALTASRKHACTRTRTRTRTRTHQHGSLKQANKPRYVDNRTRNSLELTMSQITHSSFVQVIGHQSLDRDVY